MVRVAEKQTSPRRELSHEGQAGVTGVVSRQLEVETVVRKRGDLARHHGITTLLEDQEVVGNGIRAAELLRLAVLVQGPSELPIAGQPWDWTAKPGLWRSRMVRGGVGMAGTTD